MAMPVPPKLKIVTQYVRRAENLDRSPEPEAPVVAYYCRLYATEQAMKLQDKSEEGKLFLTAMMDRLEDDTKKGMGQFTQEEGRKMTHDWALKDFNAADEEDRAGLADQGTARTFYAAGVFLDVLRQFGEPEEETNRRRVYCKWKASQILKAIKEGRTPTPGGAGEDVQTGMPSVGGGGGGGYQPAASAPQETKQHDPLAGVIPEAPTTNPFLDPAVAAADAADSDTDANPVTSTPPYELPPKPHYGGPEAPSPAYPTGGTPPEGGGQSPHAPASAPYVAPAAPYVAPAVPYVAPAAPYVAPAPAPAAPAGAPARPRYSPAPARPKTPVPLPSGSRRSGGKPMEGNMADAMEHCRYAIRALEHKDVALAVQKLQEALQQIT